MFRSRSTQGVALLALLAPAALGSCVADSVSLRITCNVAPESDCKYTEGGDCYVNGELNVESADGYSAVLRVSNGLKPRDREVPPQSEPNGVQIFQLEVHIKDSAGATLSLGGRPNPYTVPASGFIEPNDEGLVGGELLPNAYIAALRDVHGGDRDDVKTINLSVLARGKTSGDVEVESGAWPWFINVRAIDPRPGMGECFEPEDAICGLGQDAFLYACDPRMAN